MMSKYILLGITKNDIDSVTKDLQDILNLSFEEHESSYWGEYNIVNFSENGIIRIFYNFIDDDWQEEEYKEYPVLLELNRIKEPENLMNVLCENLSYITPLYLEKVEAKTSTKRYYYQNGKFIFAYEY